MSKSTKRQPRQPQQDSRPPVQMFGLERVPGGWVRTEYSVPRRVAERCITHQATPDLRAVALGKLHLALEEVGQ